MKTHFRHNNKSKLTQEEFDELNRKYALDRDPDDLGVIPQRDDHPDWYMKLFENDSDRK